MSQRVAITTFLAGLATNAASLAARAESTGSTARVAIERFAFEPASITVNAGTRVEFLNNDQVAHSVVGERDGREIFRSPDYVDEGATYSVVLSAPGEVTYYCGLHSGMKGKISVTQ